MGTRTVDLLALGLANGSWSGTSEGSRSDRIRNSVFIPINNSSGVLTQYITVSITSSLGKTVQVNMYGYTTTTGSPLFDLYWYDSGTNFNVQSYISTLKYIRCQFKYSDNSSIDVSQITSAIATIEELDTRWWLNENDRLTRNEVPQYSTDELLSPPLPATFWRLNSNNILTLNSDDWSPFLNPINEILTPPYPASLWYLDRNRILTNMLLPEPYEEKHNIIHDDVDGKEYFNQHSGVYDNALKRFNNNYRIRLELLSDGETVIGEITKDLSLTASGQITINYEQITRRSCSLSLINVENKYIPTKNSPFWLNRKFKLWLGLVVDRDTYWWSQGVFYTVNANATGRILNIEAVDKGGALDGTLKLNMTEAQYIFGRGKPITEMIKQTLALDVGNPYGAHHSPLGFGGNRPIDVQLPLIGIEYYGFKTVADISIDANSYISEMFVKMAELYAADCYYNTNGNLVFEEHIDSTGYNYAPIQWSFTDLSSTFEDVNYEYNYEGENVVTVYTNTTEAGVRNVAWTAYNTNPLSPLNVTTGIRRASHIEIPYYYNEELTQEEQEAQQIKDCRSTANHYLLASSMLGMTLNFNCPIIPHIDVNKTISITDQYADIEDGIYVVQSVTIPLTSNKMQISATNINWLPNDMTFSGVSEVVENNNNQNGGAGT